MLVIEGLSETEEVLKAVLEPRGLHVDRISARQNGNIPPETPPPSVVVLHTSNTPSAEDSTKWDSVPRVIIGSAKMPAHSHGNSTGHYLQNPFHYGELIRVVERLLEKSEP